MQALRKESLLNCATHALPAAADLVEGYNRLVLVGVGRFVSWLPLPLLIDTCPNTLGRPIHQSLCLAVPARSFLVSWYTLLQSTLRFIVPADEAAREVLFQEVRGPHQHARHSRIGILWVWYGRLVPGFRTGRGAGGAARHDQSCRGASEPNWLANPPSAGASCILHLQRGCFLHCHRAEPYQPALRGLARQEAAGAA